MRRNMFFGVGLVLAAAIAVPGQKAEEPEFEDEQQYRERMHDIDHSFSEMQKHRATTWGPEVEEEASRLVTLFGKVEAFWEGRGDEEAAGFARMAREGAEEAKEAAKKRERKSLEAAMDSIEASCEGCHREPLDKYRIRTRLSF